MSFSERAQQAIANTPPVECVGCGCEVEYTSVQFTSDTLQVVGYTCSCGTVVDQGIYAGGGAR